MASRSRSPSAYPDATPINLNRLLSRLERTVLIDPSPQLRKSSYQRARVSANIEHARTLLLNLEHSASTAPSKSKKSALQSDLQQKRELIKQLNQRLYELNQLHDSESEGSADSEEEEDNLPTYAPRVNADAGLELSNTGGQGNEAFQDAARNLTSEVRRRGGARDDSTTTATGNSLFPSKPTATTGDPSVAQTEGILSNNRGEQEALTTGLLEMAKQLKQQSVHFGQTLEGDKGILDRAVSGLDKNTLGMDAASQRMGTLRRMTEGKGWWARIKLYAMIFGLWVFAFLIVLWHVSLSNFTFTTCLGIGTLRDLAGKSLSLMIEAIKPWKPTTTTSAASLRSLRSRSLCCYLLPSITIYHYGHTNDAIGLSCDTEAEYDRLRGLARQEAQKRSSCFDRAHEAYTSGDGARAKQLSDEGKQHAAKMDQYNQQARDYIFRENNAESRVASDTVDLHGLFVEEAEDVLEERIRAARQRGETHLHVIVGKGNHSQGHVQKIKPRVEQVCHELGLKYKTEENEGRIYVDLQGGEVHTMPPLSPAPSHDQGQHGGQAHHGGQQTGGQHHGRRPSGVRKSGRRKSRETDNQGGLMGLLKSLKCCVVM
ncbi:DUF1771-domain-containing protein [Massarina eburnea CBS 473.64]|uniref:DUF1771-domain-containing protein n=1 Tax=Massarina eburnea CBS 473.64 TaxID=1395130 RepID=A0A6A6S7J9_9PLEO|nr:DUF1771-domain-containing protein [Massarina eburnea CBS 473.64]